MNSFYRRNMRISKHIIDSSFVSSELCEIVLEKLGLPGITANPLVAKSFESSLISRDKTLT
jgi:hypothetical protein